MMNADLIKSPTKKNLHLNGIVWENKKKDLCKYVLTRNEKRLAILRFKKPDSFTARAYVHDTEYTFQRAGTFFNVVIYLDESGKNRPVAMIKKRYWYDQSKGDIMFEDGKRFTWRIYDHPLATLTISDDNSNELISYSYNQQSKFFEPKIKLTNTENNLHLLIIIIGWYLTPRHIINNKHFDGTVESFLDQSITKDNEIKKLN